ncbi:MAG: hypothetical protein F4X36_20920, partial [Gammaproteobacteria bacterium]|nr:hypothetical protein [Gammaproteobacteria bacterium]
MKSNGLLRRWLWLSLATVALVGAGFGASPDGSQPAAPTGVTGSAGAANAHTIPYFPSASDPLGRQGFVRVVNHESNSGTVSVVAIDDAGSRSQPLTLAIDGNQTRHFNSDDLAHGNPDKGLTGSAGSASGDWRLELTSELDIEPLSYIRTRDGFLTAMHDVVAAWDGGYQVVFFNPGSNRSQVS